VYNIFSKINISIKKYIKLLFKEGIFQNLRIAKKYNNKTKNKKTKKQNKNVYNWLNINKSR